MRPLGKAVKALGEGETVFLRRLAAICLSVAMGATFQFRGSMAAGGNGGGEREVVWNQRKKVENCCCERLAELATKSGHPFRRWGRRPFSWRANCSTGSGCASKAQVFYLFDFQISLFRNPVCTVKFKPVFPLRGEPQKLIDGQRQHSEHQMRHDLARAPHADLSPAELIFQAAIHAFN